MFFLFFIRDISSCVKSFFHHLRGQLIEVKNHRWLKNTVSFNIFHSNSTAQTKSVCTCMQIGDGLEGSDWPRVSFKQLSLFNLKTVKCIFYGQGSLKSIWLLPRLIFLIKMMTPKRTFTIWKKYHAFHTWIKKASDNYH